MAWQANVERFREDLKARGADELGGVDFHLAWIQRESGGVLGKDNYYKGAIGLYQLTEENADSVGFGNLQKLQDDKDYSLDAGIALVKFYANLAEKKLQGMGWEGWGRDTKRFWAIVKMIHSSPVVFGSLLDDVQAKLGREPSDWNEFVNTALNGMLNAKLAKNLNTKYGNSGDYAQRVLINDSAVAHFANGNDRVNFLKERGNSGEKRTEEQIKRGKESSKGGLIAGLVILGVGAIVTVIAAKSK